MTTPKSIGRSLNFATGRMNALCQKLLDPHELSLPQWVILSCLWREGEMGVGRLAELIDSGFPATSRIVERMVERDLLVRRKHETDGRIMLVALTKKGEDLSHLSDFHERINTLIFGGFSAEEQDLAFSLLSRMHQNAIAALEDE